MKPTALMCVLALAGAVAACNTGDPTIGVKIPDVPDAGACDLTPGDGACMNEADIAVYQALEYTNDEGEFSTCNAAASAIGSDCIFGSTESIPTVEGCNTQAGVVIACFTRGDCTEEQIDDLATCVALCTQATTAEITDTDGLSDECMACTGDTVACGAAFCTGACVSDTNAPGCIDCRCENNCIQSFDECSGLPPNPPAVCVP